MALDVALSKRTSLNVLVFTPTPTHPTIQGNRQRVFDMCRAMQSLGAHITLLYYATEGVGPAAARQMRETWGNLEILFPRGFVHRRGFVRYHAIDDWYDDTIDAALDRLCGERKFDVCVVNYAWYSRVLERLPSDIVRVIDAHDIFGGRAERFTEIGLDPVWFHTSAAEESIGLDRADFVVAIQDEEARTLRQRTESPVHSIGFLSSARFLPLRRRGPAERLRVGYIGSANPFNVASVLAFADAIKDRSEIANAFDIHIAGLVCGAVGSLTHPFILRGVVDSIAEFYDSVDIIVNPMLGGTGLKIKSLEALSFGKPLVATPDAMVGIASNHSGHQMKTIRLLIDRLMHFAAEPKVLAEEITVSQRVFRDYRREQARAFRNFWSEVSLAADTSQKPSGGLVEAPGATRHA